MDPSIYSLWGALTAFVLAWLTAYGLRRVFGAPRDEGGRFASIDGLRGFLAFSVFMHHSVIWFVYLRTGSWVAPASPLFRQFGDSAVALFFMITAFLFTSKVISSDHRPIDWTRLYVGRFIRLFPMYAVAVLGMGVMAWQLTGRHRYVEWSALLDELVRWAGFTIGGRPNVNGLPDAAMLIASVTWSLPYEWWFYLSLPVLAWLTRHRPPALALMLGAVTVLLAGEGWGLAPERLLPFAGGMVSAWLVRDERFVALAKRRLTGLVVAGALVATVLFTRTAYSALGVSLLFVAFALISAGNDLFGLLSSPASRTLGEVTYSMYLIHGLVLSFAFRFVFGMGQAAHWSPLHHWAVILGLTVPLVVLSYGCYRVVEAPAQRLTPYVMARLRQSSRARNARILDSSASSAGAYAESRGGPSA
jgi:peptidoglycan/LPS O-acetylase OafA/YrhL